MLILLPQDGGNERVVLFVKMADGLELTEDVKGNLFVHRRLIVLSPNA